MLEWELNEIYDSKTKGIQIRSKAKWIENGRPPPPQNVLRLGKAASMS